MFLIKETLALFIFNYTEIINATQNDMISSAVDKCWAPEVSGPSIEVFPAHNDEGIIITDIPVTEVPSITILDTPAMVEQPNNIIVFPEQRSRTRRIILFLLRVEVIALNYLNQ
ncbi:hypothetical protein [Clostridium sp. ZBS2]|uniref:hypothetical protein n=1 Tax=Clostridium sp. ZBS2 TaxID=2949976 RepID=UPI002079F7CF|nr:hypothetical protein [Clostridium sp. ZBS2]